MVKVILVSGYKGAGKDYVSKILSEQIVNSTVMSYAEPLKDIIATTFNVSLDDLDRYKNEGGTLWGVNEDTKEFNLITNYRKILQRFGTEAMKKHFGKGVWSALFISKLPESGVVICPDWRFEQEYFDLLYNDEVDVITLRVDNFKHEPDDHASEREIEDFMFDYRIDNTNKDGSILADIDYFISNYQLWS